MRGGLAGASPILEVLELVRGGGRAETPITGEKQALE